MTRRNRRRRRPARSAITANARSRHFPATRRTASLSYRYFIGMVEQVRQVHLQDLTGNAVLLGRPAQIITSAPRLRAPAAPAEEGLCALIRALFPLPLYLRYR
jgi:hypothetical protein